MKFWLLLFGGLLALSGSVFSQSKGSITLKGTLSTSKLPTEIELFSVQEGALTPHAKATISKDGSFVFDLKEVPYTGFYRLGQYYNSAILYLSPGAKVSVAVSEYNYKVAKGTDKENVALHQWSVIADKVNRNRRRTMTPYIDVWAELPDILKSKDSFFASLKSGNKVFDNLLKDMAQAQFEYELCNLTLSSPNNKPPVSSYPAIYQEIKKGNSFRTAAILNYDFGMQYLNTYLQFIRNIEAGKNSITVSSTDLCEQYVQSDTLKGIYLLSALSKSKSYDPAFIKSAERIEKYLLTPRLKSDFQNLVTNVKILTKGQPAINFGGTTPQGKQASLADLKGKLVVVDLWATWCVPCKKEIPFLKVLEEEMEGKDVAFLSLAISDNKEKWLKFVEEESLGGVQLFADAKAEDLMTNTYKVNGIPRFMVFDKNGNIVSIDAPRPSSPALKAMIERELGL